MAIEKENKTKRNLKSDKANLQTIKRNEQKVKQENNEEDEGRR